MNWLNWITVVSLCLTAVFTALTVWEVAVVGRRHWREYERIMAQIESVRAERARSESAAWSTNR